MWTNAVVQIGSYEVGLALELLPAERRVPMAASIAWITVLAATEGEDVHKEAWRTFVDDVLYPHVAFTVPHPHPEQLDGGWWLEAIRSALMALVEVNALGPLISEQLPSAYHLALAPRAVS